jgi:hypothetical protein
VSAPRRKSGGRQASKSAPSAKPRAAPAATSQRIKTPIDLVLRARSRKKKTTPAGSGPDQRGEELPEVLAALIEHRTKRRRDLSIIRSFFEDPVRFVMQSAGAGGQGKREQRRKHLRARVDVLRALLALMEGELLFLSQAQPAPRGGQAQPPTELAPTNRSSGTS